MKKRKMASLFFTACILLSVFSGCGNTNLSSESSAAASSASSATSVQQGSGSAKEMNLSWYINYDWFAGLPWATENPGEVWIKDTKKVNINYISSGGAASQKLATMIIDQDYPDLITVDRGQDLQKLIAAKAVVPLDDYMTEDTNLTKWLDESTINMLRSEDGKFYGFPNWAIGGDSPNGNGGWMYQNKWYSEMGSPELKTYDELYDYLVQLKAKHPDVLPLLLGEDLMGAQNIYGGMSEGNNPGYFNARIAVKDNKPVSYLEDGDVQKTYEFINKLYREGLISQDLFTMTGDQRNEIIRSGKVGVFTSSNIVQSGAQMQDLAAEDPESNFVAVDPIVASGVDVANVANNSYNKLGWNVTCISKNVENPEEVFAFMDWWFGSEGQMASVYGAPGDLYEAGEYTSEGYPVNLTDKFLNMTPDEISQYWSDANYLGNTTFLDGFARYCYKIDAPLSWTKKIQIPYIWTHSFDATELSNIVPNFDTEEGVIYQNLDLIYKQAIPEIVLSSSDEECKANIQKYITELYDAGLQKVLDYQTSVWQNNLKILGK